MNEVADVSSFAFIAAVVLFILRKVFDIDRKLENLCTRLNYIERYIRFDDKQEKNR